MTQNLAAANREKYDYTAFLKKFAVMGEVMKINDDEFDCDQRRKEEKKQHSCPPLGGSRAEVNRRHYDL